MADDSSFSTPNAPASKFGREKDYLIIRMWPKTPVLYPMALIALICALVSQFAGSDSLNVFEPVTSPEIIVVDEDGEIESSESVAEEEADIPVEEPVVDEVEEPVEVPVEPEPVEEIEPEPDVSEEISAEEPADVPVDEEPVPADDPTEVEEDATDALEVIEDEVQADESTSEETDPATSSRGTSLTILAAQMGGSPQPTTVVDADDEMSKKRVDRMLGVIFLLVLLVSLFSICVDMDVRWAVIYFSSIIIIALLLWIVNIYTNFFPGLTETLDEVVTPMANAKFYFGIFCVWVFLLFISFIVTRFHYVRIESNEIIVVGGMLERQQRYSTMRMRYVKEIQDVMEYYLPFVRSGRLVFSFPEHSEAIIIDNVININKVTRKLDKLVSSFQVQ